MKKLLFSIMLLLCVPAYSQGISTTVVTSATSTSCRIVEGMCQTSYSSRLSKVSGKIEMTPQEYADAYAGRKVKIARLLYVFGSTNYLVIEFE